MTTDENALDNTLSTPKKKNFFQRHPVLATATATTSIAVTAAGWWAHDEITVSLQQSKIFSRVAADGAFPPREELHPGDIVTIPTATGPYDVRAGYNRAQDIRDLLTASCTVDPDANPTAWRNQTFFDLQLYPIYDIKTQTGLQIRDTHKDTVYQSTFPRNVYHEGDAIPDLLVKSLLLVENRALLDTDRPATWNPAIEWPRQIWAAFAYGAGKIGLPVQRAGGSTLAIQLEKVRHTPNGRTENAIDKLRQAATATARAYSNGPETHGVRDKIIRDYINSVPFTSYPRYGEVIGFGDALRLWFDTDFEQANAILSRNENLLSDAGMEELARTYRKILSLVVAVQRPTDYLIANPSAMHERVDRFLPLLAEHGIISERLRDLALAIRVDPVLKTETPRNQTSKALTSLRIDLMQLLQVPGFYNLDRMDLSADTTLNNPVNDSVTERILSYTTQDGASAANLTGYRMLKPEQAGDIIYSFSLYEKSGDTNLLRVQTDNFPGQFNMNEGSKLELGSTAKLRTLISYLDMIERLYHKYLPIPPDELEKDQTLPDDDLTRWVVDYLTSTRPDIDMSLNGILEAAMQRPYSAHTGEFFFTGGGRHVFNNFEPSDSRRVLSVRDSFNRSVNLPFIRMMRDIIRAIESHDMNIDPTLFTDPDHPQRHKHLMDFVHMEATGFLWNFWNAQNGRETGEVDSMLAAKTKGRDFRLATLYRTLYPDAPYEDMAAFIAKECTECEPDSDYNRLYNQYAPGKFDLNDLGYITRIHPLELWFTAYRRENPNATWSDVVRDSESVRVDSYKWLLRSQNMSAQNRRIRTMIEREAFTHLHKSWQATGFPFDTMVPSYASALGSSGDTPAALSDLVGILVNGGVRKPMQKMGEVRFGVGTPYQTIADCSPRKDPVQVLSPEVSQLALREMQGVVETGTARRAARAVRLGDGTILPLGGKTGTGDNRVKTYTARGAMVSSAKINRTATFVFTIDDRFFGTIVTYVPGDLAADFNFTSALPVQALRGIIPDLMPMIEESYSTAKRHQPTPEAGQGDMAAYNYTP